MRQETSYDLKDAFHTFLSLHQNELERRPVDYIGVNIANNATRKDEFKIYYSDSSSQEQTHPLLEFLEGRDMIRYRTMVQDREDPCRLRFDIGLKNRTNENMTSVFAWLEQNTAGFGRFRKEVEALSDMKVTQKEGFDHAGLYFLGFISIDSRIEILKFHFFNRICEEPDVLHKNLTFDDEYFLTFLEESGIPGFRHLPKILRSALTNCGGHLWMTGADYSETRPLKYKIYIKNPTELYSGLLDTLSGEEYRSIRRRIAAVRDLNEEHGELLCEGFAICEDESGSLSINFYFKRTSEA